MLSHVNLEYYEKSFFLHYLGMENLVDTVEFVSTNLKTNYIMVSIFYLRKLIKRAVFLSCTQKTNINRINRKEASKTSLNLRGGGKRSSLLPGSHLQSGYNGLDTEVCFMFYTLRSILQHNRPFQPPHPPSRQHYPSDFQAISNSSLALWY